MYNVENMIKWAEALESGEYVQYRNGWSGIIQVNGGKRVRAHCCLDVACEMFAGAGYEAINSKSNATSIEILRPYLGISALEKDDFIGMNDYEDKSFTEIAAHIRSMVAKQEKSNG